MEKRKGKRVLMATPIKLHECLTNSDIAKLEFKTTISNKIIKKKNYCRNGEEKKEKGKKKKLVVKGRRRM